jgi:hypothetical protein
MDRLLRSFSMEALLFWRIWSGRMTGSEVAPTMRSRCVLP